MPVTIGTRLGSYEITALLGKGGFGEVYRATDQKLKRDVAIKILSDEFSRDHDHISRFEREARVLASLNHPNIAQIYGLEESGPSRCIVMEWVDGETLRQRLTRGAIPVDEALKIARRIAEALEAAHERGIIHRDLKPGNIMLASDGKVKVLDFGLAKAIESEPASDLSSSPTLMSAMSSPGMILGTASYMSPEQAKSRPLDKRTDIFAFGSVLYEMLTGKRAFDGEDVSDILSAVLKMEPDWKVLPAGLSPRVREMIELCLQKDPKQRRRDAGDLVIDIERAGTGSDAKSAKTNSQNIWAAAAITMAIVSAILAGFYFKARNTPEPDEIRVEIPSPATQSPPSFALSPDGKSVVFGGSRQGPDRLWLRRLENTEAKPLAGTERGTYPFWSPDGRSVGFFANGKLERIDLAGGPPQALADAANLGGSWAADNTILFVGRNEGLWRINASGGQPAVQTQLRKGEGSHRFPQFLPGGKSFLYFVQGNPETQGVYFETTEGTQSKRLMALDSAAAFLAPDHIVFMRQTALQTQRFDPSRGILAGDPVTIADPVDVDIAFFVGAFSVSASGRLAYRAGGNRRQLFWLDRKGTQLAAVGEPDSNNLLAPELSPDGRRVALDRMPQNNRDVWLMDLVRGAWTRLTIDPSQEGYPQWSPDGSKIAFISNRNGPYDIYLKASNAVGPEQALLESDNQKVPQDWSRDGRYLLYRESDQKTAADLKALPMSGGDRKPTVIAGSPFIEDGGQFSPDGRWVAYQTNENGTFQIVVQSFPNPSTKQQVSTGGGAWPRWRSDGKELYFVSDDSKLMAAAVRLSDNSFEFDTPVALFQTRIVSGFNKVQYAVSADGRFLINQTVTNNTTTPITLILNWKPKVSGY